MDPMCFERWRDNQPLQEATEKFSAAAKNFLAVRDSAETDDRIAARKLWQNLSAQYWDVLSALVDAHTEDIPDELIFDDRERLFIDFGYVSDELTPASPSCREPSPESRRDSSSTTLFRLHRGSLLHDHGQAGDASRNGFSRRKAVRCGGSSTG